MAASVKVLTKLFEVQRDLNAQQVKISQDLVLVNQKILYALALHADHVKGTDTVKAIGPNAAQMNSHVSGTRRSWFERGETAKLIRRVVRRAMRPAQVVHAVMDAKGYSKSLDVADRKRVQAALHQAVIIAVKTGTLVRDPSGTVRVKA